MDVKLITVFIFCIALLAPAVSLASTHHHCDQPVDLIDHKHNSHEACSAQVSCSPNQCKHYELTAFATTIITHRLDVFNSVVPTNPRHYLLVTLSPPLPPPIRL